MSSLEDLSEEEKRKKPMLKKRFYRSQSDLSNDESSGRFKEREFQEGAAFLDAPVSRRTFLKLMGATAALAGASGCSFNFRKPVQTIYPYAKRSEYDVADQSLYFATSMALGEDVVGVLAKSYEGRPIKIEGNPSHSQSLGATGIFQQSSLLDLYDPDRQKNVSYLGKYRSKEDFSAWLKGVSTEHFATQGEGLCILTEAQTSPTFYRLMKRFQLKFPKAKVFSYEPINNDNRLRGIYSVTGRWYQPDYFYDKARLIVSLDSDFLGLESGSLLATKRFANGRDPEKTQNKLSRMYVCEPQLTVTGSKADHRLAIKGLRVEYFLYVLVAKLLDARVVTLPSTLVKQVRRLAFSYEKEVDIDFLRALVEDILKYRKQVLFVAGPRQPEQVHALLYLLNKQLSSRTLHRYRSHAYQQFSFVTESNVTSIRNFAAHLKTGVVDTFLCLGGDPVYQAPSDVDVVGALKFVKNKVHVTLHENDTSTHCDWVVPRSHYLESWGDLKASDGSSSVVQPVIRPLYDSLSDNECMSLLVSSYSDGYRLLRATWRQFSNKQWRSCLHNGVLSVPSSDEWGVSFSDRGCLKALSKVKLFKRNQYMEIGFVSSFLYDGRFSNNGWLQELPDSISKLTWDNAALIGVETASKFSLKSGDVVTLRVKDRDIDIPVFVLPGHVSDSITLSLGYGRRVAGRVGERKGFDVYPMIRTDDFYFAEKATLIKTGDVYPFASTQEHGSMEDRPFYRQANLSHYIKHPEFAKEMVEVENLQSLWKEREFTDGNQWGMVIDLARCTGCSVCTIACQAENNIPIVGKEEVLNGREMHWIRVDRYFEGEGESATAVHQPVACLHCETAPCEQVCPVAATVHGEEGTNDMVYNRCVGTRYCADNCPAKVRRFNYFDYHQRNPQAQSKDRVHFFDYLKEPDPTIQLQFNPNVTVRMRGVMEKCSFCIQRIMKGKSDAGNDQRDILDGEVQTACQQACPAEAISFGNILDKNSEVFKKKDLHRDYHILNELHLKARVSYSASITNPNSHLAHKKESAAHG
ncbi:MAG: TAT-variant-translocated molybdopterin oxidoreductase [bacterium]